MAKSNKIAVLGGGLWGTVLAAHLSRRNARVWLWEFFPEAAAKLARTRRHPHLPGFKLPEDVRVDSDLGLAAGGAQVVLMVMPSQHVRATARSLARVPLSRDAAAVSASKGIEPGSLATMAEILAGELPALKGRVYALSGPSFAVEVARGVPTRMILAGSRGATRQGLKELFDGGALRVTTSDDRAGVELGGALKNAFAIGCGIVDGLVRRDGRAGDNTKAALFSTALSEMGRIIAACGGDPATLVEPACLGDLIATGTSASSRNRTFGEKLGAGLSPARARREIPTVVEGIEASASARALARGRGLKLPLLEAIWGVVHRSRPPWRVVEALGF